MALPGIETVADILLRVIAGSEPECYATGGLVAQFARLHEGVDSDVGRSGDQVGVCFPSASGLLRPVDGE
jgi:hypothetical protein